MTYNNSRPEMDRGCNLAELGMHPANSNSDQYSFYLAAGGVVKQRFRVGGLIKLVVEIVEDGDNTVKAKGLSIASTSHGTTWIYPYASGDAYSETVTLTVDNEEYTFTSTMDYTARIAFRFIA